jgi:multiple sugar transport system substrate-binding protein
VIKKIKILISFLIIVPVLSLSGCGFKKAPIKQYSLNLEVWGLFDEEAAFADFFENYKKIDPNVENITYKKLSQDTYQKDLLDALAAGKGPDIFLIQNTWLPGFLDKTTPATADIMNEQTLRNQFPDVVADDFLQDGKVYALPLSIDSLALYYNKDLFNQAGITAPPATWEEFAMDAQKLTKIDAFGNINQSGAAMGTAYNINRSTDIANLLMLQNGLSIVNRKSKDADFNNDAGIKALDFYTQFVRSANPAWNLRMHYSIDAFAEGNLAMMLNYSWQIPVLKSKSPKLNFGIAPIPQFANASNKIGYANYWAYGVSKNQQIKTGNDSSVSAVPVSNETRNAEAWKLISYMTMKQTAATSTAASGATGGASSDSVKDFLFKTQKPAARRDLIEWEKNDVNLGVFALGNLYAKSWYQIDPTATGAIMAEIIEQIVAGQTSIREGVQVMAARINSLAK